MKYRLVIIDRAEHDAAHIFQWLHKFSPQGAISWHNAFVAAVQQVARRPEYCGIAEESSRLRIELREKLFKTRRGHKYRIVF
jgi:plasmid stabilization system protein ParE